MATRGQVSPIRSYREHSSLGSRVLPPSQTNPPLEVEWRERLLAEVEGEPPIVKGDSDLGPYMANKRVGYVKRVAIEGMAWLLGSCKRQSQNVTSFSPDLTPILFWSPPRPHAQARHVLRRSAMSGLSG